MVFLFLIAGLRRVCLDMIDYRLVKIVRGIQESDFDGNVADGKAVE